MSLAQVRRLDPSECDDLIQSLGDTPETVIAIHQLRHGLCEAYVEAGADRQDAVILRPSRPCDELMGFGQDAESLGQVLRGLDGWSCVCVEDEIARRLGPILEAQLGRPVRYIIDIYHTLERPVLVGSHPSVRYLTGEDSDLMSGRPDRHQGGLPGARIPSSGCSKPGSLPEPSSTANWWRWPRPGQCPRGMPTWRSSRQDRGGVGAWPRPVPAS